MGVADKIITFGRALKAVSGGKSSNPGIYPVLPGSNIFGLATSNNPDNLLKAYRGWTAACVDSIADSAAKIRFRFVDSRTNEPIPVTNPCVQLFRQPCPKFTRTELWKLIYTWLELDGDAFLYKAKNQMGVIRELWPIQPNRMYIVPDPQELVKGYIFRYMGQEIPFEADEIVHLKYPSPIDPIRGLGTLEKAVYEYDIEYYLKHYRLHVFKNRGRPDAVLETEQDYDEDQFKRIREQWHKIYGGTGNAARLATLWAGLKYKQIQMNPIELDFIKSAELTRDELMGIFGVPAAKRGLIKDVNRANGYELERTFQSEIIKPKLTLVAERLQLDVVNTFDERIEAVHEENVPQDQEFILKQEDSDVKNAVRTINEIRSERDLDPVPWGNLPLVPYSTAPLGTMSLGTETKSIRVVRSLPEYRDDEEFKTNLWRAFLSVHDPRQAALERTMKSYFSDQRTDVMSRMEEFRSGKLITRMELDPDYILFDVSEARTLLESMSDPHLRDILLDGMKKGLSEIGSDADAQIGERLKTWLDVRKEKFAADINETTVNGIRHELEIGLTNSESWDQLAARVNNVFDFADEARSSNIAVTETTGAMNRGFQNSLEITEGFNKSWLTARDGNEREWHGSMDGQERGPSEYFESGKGVALMYPGDADCGEPDEICRCRCALMVRKA